MARSLENITYRTLRTAVYRIQKALARVSISLGFSAAEMNELVRRAYLDAAEEILREQGEKILTTKVCAMTGLYRKELVRLRNLPPLADTPSDAKYNRFSRVLTGWVRDEDFQTKTGKPSALQLQGSGSFSDLVKRYSGDMAPTAMQQELLRLGLVTITRSNLIKLEGASYLTSTNNDALQILGTDVADLIDIIHHNIESETERKRFQRKVDYICIPHRFVEPFREYANNESQKLLEKLDRWLAKRDLEELDENTPGSRLGVGIYHIEKRNTPDSHDTELQGNSDE